MERWDFWRVIGAIFAVVFIVYLFGCGEDDCVWWLFTTEALAIKTIIVSFAILFFALDASRKIASNENVVYRIDRYPHTKINGATAGSPVSTEGIVVADRTLIAPYCGKESVYYHSITEVYKKSGDSGSWVVTENIAEYAPFRIRDDKDEISVELRHMSDDLSGYKITQLKKATIIGEESNREISIANVPSQTNNEIDCVKVMYQQSSGGYTRKTEYILLPNSKVFVYGMVSKIRDRLVVHASENEPLIVSKRTKEEYVEDFFGGRANRAIYWSNFLVSIGLTALYLGAIKFIPVSVLILLLAQLGLFFFLVIRIYNRIVLLFQRAQDSLSQIAIQLKRRAVLIPNINTVVQAYAKHEKGTFVESTAARAGGIKPSNASEGARIYEQDTSNLKRAIAVIEDYPELKASGQFKKMMDILVDSEERISYSRSFYNRTVLKYNNLITTLPGVFYAILFGFRRIEYFSVEKEDEREATAVRF